MKIILIIVAVYYTMKLLFRFIAPILLVRFTKKMQDRFKQYQYSEFQQQKEGEVTIDKINNTNRKNSSDLGEYVDFEEIEE